MSTICDLLDEYAPRLKTAQFKVFYVIARAAQTAGGVVALSHAELAQRSGYVPGTVAVAVRALAAAGLIQSLELGHNDRSVYRVPALPPLDKERGL